MKTSIFKKQFFLYIGILAITLAILGVTLAQIWKSYYMIEKENLLIKQGERITRQYAQAYYTGVLDSAKLNNEFEILEQYVGAKVLFVDNNKKVLLVSQSIDQFWVGKTLTEETFNTVFQGQIISIQGQLNSIFNETMLTVGYPIKIDNKVYGALFMNLSLPDIQKSIQNAYKIIIGCLFFSTILAFILIYISCKRMVNPLMQMNDAAKIIASGNFEKRLSIKTVDEIGQLAESFNNMAESLYKQEKIKKEFIANISHDLRSPLTSIQGFITAILDGTIPSDKKDHYLHVVLEETKRLTQLANDVLEMEKAEFYNDTGLHITSFDVSEMIREILIKLESQVRRKKLTVKLILSDDETFVLGDADKIMRAVYNIVDNSIQFNKEGGSIVIETSVAGEKVFVSIEDTGVGIPADKIKRIFDRFFKADASRGKNKKSGGLGLSIAKEFLKAHGESIVVTSKEGEGTKFVFSLQSHRF